ncbi:MAG: hypothetical protein HQ559_02100 [Lentisphaerae bacterium]|nr:hypothetical protein [Lentisphaerota bacterium]
MKTDILDMLKRQSAWQASRAKLPWAAKLRMSLTMRQAQKALRQTKPAAAKHRTL